MNKYTKSNLPERIKLLEKCEIFPKGYEFERRGKIAYFKAGCVHGLPVNEVLKALNNGKAKEI